MLKPTAAYKMSKSAKIYLGNTRHQPGRRHRHAMIIDSELSAQAANQRRNTRSERDAKE